MKNVFTLFIVLFASIATLIGQTNPRLDVLPVEFTSFEVFESEGTVTLTWETAAELNNDRFEIEWSIDGSSFDYLTEIKGQGTTQSVHAYRFEYELSMKESIHAVYYRLRQVDYDGEEMFSEIRSIALRAGVDIDVYPNPAVKGLNVHVQGVSEGPLTIYSAGGMQVQALTHYANGNAIIASNSLAPGMYIIKVADRPASTLIIE